MYKPWLSRLLDESAFPMLALAVAVSQVKLELHNNDAVHDRGQPSREVRSDDRFQPNAEKNGRHPAESAASDKESAHNQ